MSFVITAKNTYTGEERLFDWGTVAYYDRPVAHRLEVAGTEATNDFWHTKQGDRSGTVYWAYIDNYNCPVLLAVLPSGRILPSNDLVNKDNARLMRWLLQGDTEGWLFYDLPEWHHIGTSFDSLSN